ncbi:MAG: ACT domain-containing protein, partial [Pseudomonadales bacterium]
GQTIEIITAPGAQPNPSWLSFVVSGKARSNIRHVLKNQRHTESVKLGKRLLDKALHNLGTSIKELPQERKQALLDDTGHDNFDFILEDIGLGNRVAFLTARRLVPEYTEVANVDAQDIKPLIIQGTEGVMINFARCCHPIPGDNIIGHISAGRGVVVHLDSCRNIADVHDNPEKCVPLNWSAEADGEFRVELRVELLNQRGIIAELANKINSLDVQIDKISTEDRDAQFGLVHLELDVKNRVHLARIMRRIRSIKAVTKVSRV